jgi:hypothetical protein
MAENAGPPCCPCAVHGTNGDDPEALGSQSHFGQKNFRNHPRRSIRNSSAASSTPGSAVRRAVRALRT